MSDKVLPSSVRRQRINKPGSYKAEPGFYYKLYYSVITER